MEPKRKLVGYYLSKTGKVLKAYKVLHKKGKRNYKGKKLSKKVRVYKLKSKVPKKRKVSKKRKSPKRKVSKKRKSPKRKVSKKRKSPKRKTKFGSEPCYISAPFFGQDTPRNPLGWKWPGGPVKTSVGQFYYK